MDTLLLGADNFRRVRAQSLQVDQYAVRAKKHHLALVVPGVHHPGKSPLDEMVAIIHRNFVLVLQPMKDAGQTGSTVAPIALR